MKRHVLSKLFPSSSSLRVLCVACLAAALAGTMMPSPAFSEEPKAAEAKTAEVTIKGTCVFSGKNSTWSAKLTPKADNTYDAVYAATWNGKALDYVGTVTSDMKTTISGTGKASGGAANGSFEFTGKFGDDGVATCSYKEVGGRGRSGTVTVEAPK